VTASGCVFARSRTVAVTVKRHSAARFAECLFSENEKGGVSDKGAVFLDAQTVVTGCQVECKPTAQPTREKGGASTRRRSASVRISSMARGVHRGSLRGDAAAGVYVSEQAHLSVTGATVAGTAEHGIVATDATTVAITGIAREGVWPHRRG
jgi:hypothetical protein